jgi:serine-type D-Ala-D-Ala carboxypeptidase/endopeptidase (penicillin-binding protein 4)
MKLRVFIKQSFTLVVLLLLMASCSPISHKALTKKIKSFESKFQHHTGFMLYDVEQRQELYSFQSGRYFTPASNTKILTFYTALILLGDSVPAFQYVEREDSLIIRGMGDPSFLYQKTFDSRKAFDFLTNQDKQLYLLSNNFYTEPLGVGWSWDDSFYSYASERAAFPLYGNTFLVKRNGNTLNTFPNYFSFQIQPKDSTETLTIKRDFNSNKILVYAGRKKSLQTEWLIPFKTSAELSALLLSDTLKKSVSLIKGALDFAHPKTLYSVPVDSLYKVMMQESDNFVAEQLLLLCAHVLSDSLKPEIAITHMKKNYLNDLPDTPQWVDGSGLSRYNLLTPRSLVKVWEKIYRQIPRERLFNLLAVSGKSGTLKNNYKSDSPYIYGKTGTFRNNYSLSGYLVTKKGRTLIFCFMNNNYPARVQEVRADMEKILLTIYTHY